MGGGKNSEIEMALPEAASPMEAVVHVSGVLSVDVLHEPADGALLVTGDDEHAGGSRARLSCGWRRGSGRLFIDEVESALAVVVGKEDGAADNCRTR